MEHAWCLWDHNGGKSFRMISICIILGRGSSGGQCPSVVLRITMVGQSRNNNLQKLWLSWSVTNMWLERMVLQMWAGLCSGTTSQAHLLAAWTASVMPLPITTCNTPSLAMLLPRFCASSGKCEEVEAGALATFCSSALMAIAPIPHVGGNIDMSSKSS